MKKYKKYLAKIFHGRYYWTCPKCGANLDPGEKCDCETRQA